MAEPAHGSADKPLLPSEVSDAVGFFDRFAGRATELVSRAPFFAFSIALVGAWIAEGLVLAARSGDWSKLGDSAYQLQINSTTTIITFLMVALLQNSSSRADKAVQHKLNAIADGLADLMTESSRQFHDDGLDADVAELRAAVGLEHRESSTEDDGGGA